MSEWLEISISIVIFVLISIFIVNLPKIWDFIAIMRAKKDGDAIMSFREALDLTDLPVVTFYHHRKKLNFLLDTGSSLSHINKAIASDLEYELTGDSTYIIGIEAAKNTVEFCKMTLSYKGKKFDGTFGLSDLEESFKIVKKETGVQIHGVLGNDFMSKYSYILDFDSMIAYSTNKRKK